MRRLTVVITARADYVPQHDDFNGFGDSIENAVNALVATHDGHFETVDVEIQTGPWKTDPATGGITDK